jgi:hypothetical protein
MSSDRFRARLPYVCTILVLAALVFLRHSELAGRLADDLTYDDVGYAYDAAARLFLLSGQGVGAFFASIIEDPPHSIFSTSLALVAFMVGGVNEFSLYFSNVIILIALGIFVSYELRKANVTTLSIALIFLLVSPMAYRAIHDFRPDIALGLATAAMVILFIKGMLGDNSASVRRAGVLFGACLLIKPTFFAHTIAIAVFLAGLSIGNNLLAQRGLTLWPRMQTSRVVWFFGIGFLIALPYVVLNGIQVFDYFWTNTRGEISGIWSYSENTPFVELVRSFFSITFNLIGYHLIAATLVACASMGVLIAYGSSHDAKASALQLLVALVSLSIIIYGRHKNEYFLASFQWIVLLTAVFSYAKAVELLRNGRALQLNGLMLVISAVLLFANSGIKHWTHSYEASRNGGSWNQRVFDTIRDDVLEHRTEPLSRRPVVFVSFSGPISGDSLRWIGYRDRFQLEVSSTYTSNSLDAARSTALAADYVVVPNQVKANYYSWLPSGEIQSEFIEWIFSSQHFEPVGELESDSNYFVYRRKAATEYSKDVVIVDGLATLDGFLPQEGPYPQWSLPVVRWMISEHSRLCVFGSRDGAYQLKLSMKAEHDGAMKVELNGGDEIGNVSLRQGAFRSDEFGFKATGSSFCVDFHYQSEHRALGERLVLFSSIEIRPLSFQ